MATVMWLLVITISLQCWCEVDSKECQTLSECRVKMLNNWYDTSYKRYVLQKDEKDYLDSLVINPRARSITHAGTRRECRTLSKEERYLLVKAFNWVFTTRPHPAGHTHYRIFVSQHRRENSPGAHFGPCFPGWHREYLTRFEKALQQFDRNVNLCYWDSSLDEPLPEAADSALWTPDFFGNGEGEVTTGIAANLLTFPDDCASRRKKLYRNITSGQNHMLFNKRKIDELLEYSSFTELMNSQKFEGHHGRVHNFVGGQMSNLNCAPLDPVFWFHHTFVDYLWEKCRQNQKTDKERDYPTGSAVLANHSATDTMFPFDDKICGDGLSNNYIPDIYSYAPSPSNCKAHGDCGGKALWCNSGKCTAAVRLNGEMKVTWPKEACYIPSCPTGTTPKNVKTVCTCSP